IDDQDNPSVAMDAAGNSVIVWRSYKQDGSFSGIYGQRYNAGGNPIGNEFQVNQTTYLSQKMPSVAMDAMGNFVVVWASYDNGTDEGIWARHYNANGQPTTGELPVNNITDGRQLNPKIAMNDNGDFVVGWERWNHPTQNWRATARQFNANGTPKGSEFDMTQLPHGHNPSVATNNSGDSVGAWMRSGDSDDLPLGYYIRTRRYNANGIPKENACQITQDMGGNTDRTSIAMDGSGNYIVTWKNYGDSTSHAQRFDSNGNYISEIILSYCDIDVAMDQNGLSTLVWNSGDLMAQQYDSLGNPLGILNLHPGGGNDMVVAMARDGSGRFIVAWEGGDADGLGVFATIVPESTTLSLLALGGLLIYRRRKY
ncbi:MAG: PEP-CTERM sorting domain-containing protein, partial [Planctomycetota bacterium]